MSWFYSSGFTGGTDVSLQIRLLPNSLEGRRPDLAVRAGQSLHPDGHQAEVLRVLLGEVNELEAQPCTYPDCACPVGFPEGYKPGVTECPMMFEESELFCFVVGLILAILVSAPLWTALWAS